MIENVIDSLGGVGIYGVVSICLFFGFFLGMLIWATRLKKSYLNSMGELPLDAEAARQDASDETSNRVTRHE